eukprot:2423128-Rhodomonas_salina.1
MGCARSSSGMVLSGAYGTTSGEEYGGAESYVGGAGTTLPAILLRTRYAMPWYSPRLTYAMPGTAL